MNNKENTMKGQTMEDDGRVISGSWFYRLLVRSAYGMLRRPLTVFKVLKKSVEHIRRYDSVKELTEDVKDKFQTLGRLLKSYVTREYTDVSLKNAALSLAAILYFITPLDFIPDFLLAGLIDDIALLGWVYHNLNDEIVRFLEWEEATKLTRMEIKSIEEKKD